MKKQVLIVEDEPDLAELLSYHLQKENYETVIARNGKEAIESVQHQTPDAILLDVMMPELSGWEVCRILRESTNGKSLPIIMTTALSDEEERVKGLSLGADDYVSKPYSIKELLLKIEKHIARHQAITQLKVREQEQDTAIRYMVHELRNSLTVIGGFSSNALRQDDTNKYFRTIHTAASHAESLLNDASLLSRLETGGEHLSLEQLDICPLVSEAIDLFHSEIRSKHIEILTASSTTSLVRGNKTAIRQVLINLLSNAVKYNRDGGKIWIDVDDTSGSVDISILDEGNGIGDADLDRIFDKFYRAAGSEQVKGAGLGLYIVKLLTNAMGGGITVISRPGIGSTFTVSFIKANTAVLKAVRDVA